MLFFGKQAFALLPSTSCEPDMLKNEVLIMNFWIIWIMSYELLVVNRVSSKEVKK